MRTPAKNRSSKLRARRRGLVLLAAIAVLVAPLAAAANDSDSRAFIPKSLADGARERPDALFRVIVQGDTGSSTAELASEVRSHLDDASGSRDELTGRFQSVTAVAATLTGDQVLGLVDEEGVAAITRDVPMLPTDDGGDRGSAATNWLRATRLDRVRERTRAASLPTIAVVDSGIDTTYFGGRVVAHATLTNLQPNAFGDGRGHGTFVADLIGGRRGAAPRARLVGIDVMDDHGRAMTSDVIAAADWILQNKDRFDIRVANFSLHASRPSSFRTDPLDRAVERLWFSGVVVVTSAGNYGAGRASGVRYAPANDPFVITVGATDLGTSSTSDDDSNAPWTAFGRTSDGFMKPDLGAPGRRLVARVPPTSTLPRDHPERIVRDGYMRMSGTSFSAAAVSAAAAYVIAAHPSWTPDEVKGALMQTARACRLAAEGSVGVGQIDARAAQDVAVAPNPNRALNRFLIADPSGAGAPVFDAVSWDSAVKSDASWDSAAWSDASWSDASWDSATWSDASWADASWADASWADASWADASWADASWADASWVD